MITLHDFAPSPHCVRVRLALALARLPYRTKAMTLEGDQKAPKFRALSPFGTVPVLVDGATVIAQSYAALLWIGEKRRALVPTNAAARGRVYTWVAVAATEVDPAVRAAYDAAFFTKKRDPKALRAALAKLCDAFDRCEAARAAWGPRDAYVVGRAPTIADAAMFPAWWLAKDLADDFGKQVAMDRWPRWVEWYARMSAREDVKQVLAAAEG